MATVFEASKPNRNIKSRGVLRGIDLLNLLLLLLLELTVHRVLVPEERREREHEFK